MPDIEHIVMSRCRTTIVKCRLCLLITTESLGMSINKTISMITKAEFKPIAQKQSLPGTERDFLDPLAVEKLPMIGPQKASSRHEMGVRDIATLRNMPMKFLVSAFGWETGEIDHPIPEQMSSDDLPKVVETDFMMNRRFMPYFRLFC
jgi:nucleotidyltransferase/DNA polymerase involved in DNA repair